MRLVSQNRQIEQTLHTKHSPAHIRTQLPRLLPRHTEPPRKPPQNSRSSPLSLERPHQRSQNPLRRPAHRRNAPKHPQRPVRHLRRRARQILPRRLPMDLQQKQEPRRKRNRLRSSPIHLAAPRKPIHNHQRRPRLRPTLLHPSQRPHSNPRRPPRRHRIHPLLDHNPPSNLNPKP